MNLKHYIPLLLLAAMPAGAQKIESGNTLIDCGQVTYRRPVTVEYELRNTGRRPLHIDKVRTSCGCTSVEYPTAPVEAGAAFKVRLTYDARTMGHFHKLAGIYSNAQDEPFMLTMRGIVVEQVVDYHGTYPVKLGSINADIDEVEYDDVNWGDMPQKKIHIMNPTSQTIEPQVMHLPKYLKADVSPSKLGPGRSGEIVLTLDSRNISDYGLTQTSVFLGDHPGDKVSPEKEIQVSAVMLPAFEQLSEEQLANAPRMEISTTELDLGSFNGKKKLKGEVKIKNTGKTTLDISRLQMFTSGLQLSLNRTSISPGEEATLKVTAKERELRRVRNMPRILMITNDPEHPKVVIKIKVER